MGTPNIAITRRNLLGLAACACAASLGMPASARAAVSMVVDAYGRVVEVPEQVDRVATVGSAARFVVYAGAQDKLVAVTQMDTPASPLRPYTMVYQDLFAELPTTSNGNHLMETSVDAEALLTLRPQVIVSSRSAAECDALQRQLGIPVVGISYQDQLFSDDVYRSILCVGEALGTSEHAQNVVAAMCGWADDLAWRCADIPDDERPGCYAGAVNFKGAKSFGGTYAGYAPFDAVGAPNVADELGLDGSAQIDLELLGVWDPEYMFLNADNYDLMARDYAQAKGFFDTLAAFEHGNLYSQPAFNMNGTNVELGICDAYFVGATIYPDAFADVDLPSMYDEIFETMLGAPYYDVLVDHGMDFCQLEF